MVRLTLPEEYTIFQKIKENYMASKWATFDATRDDIPNESLDRLNQRKKILGNKNEEMSKLEKKYSCLTNDPLPDDCTEIIERFQKAERLIYFEIGVKKEGRLERFYEKWENGLAKNISTPYEKLKNTLPSDEELISLIEKLEHLGDHFNKATKFLGVTESSADYNDLKNNYETLRVKMYNTLTKELNEEGGFK